MSLIVEGRVAIAPPTDELSHLVERAAIDIGDEVLSATEEPLSRDISSHFGLLFLGVSNRQLLEPGKWRYSL